MKTKKLSNREKMMLPVAVAAVSLYLYGVGRVRPGLLQVQNLKKDLAEEIQNLQTISWPTQTGSNADTIRSEIERLRRETESKRQRLADCEDSLARIDSATELQALRIEISDLARQHEIVVLKNAPTDGPERIGGKDSLAIDFRALPEAVLPSHAPFIHEYFQLMYARPLQELELVASYGSLSAFVEALGKLEHKVTVLSFQLKLSGSAPGIGQPRLHSQLILAL